MGEILNPFRVVSFENESVHYYEILVTFGGFVKSMQCNVQFWILTQNFLYDRRRPFGQHENVYLNCR